MPAHTSQTSTTIKPTQLPGSVKSVHYVSLPFPRDTSTNLATITSSGPKDQGETNPTMNMQDMLAQQQALMDQSTRQIFHWLLAVFAVAMLFQIATMVIGCWLLRKAYLWARSVTDDIKRIRIAAEASRPSPLPVQPSSPPDPDAPYRPK